MKKIPLTIIFCAIVFFTDAQILDHDDWKLSKKTAMDTCNEEDLKNFDYHFRSYEENHQLFMNKTKNELESYIAVHAFVRISNMKGINEFKKIKQEGQINKLQYRIIRADGTIADHSTIKKTNDDDDSYSNNGAIEDLDSNCELEYICVSKRYSISNDDFFGVEFIQKFVPLYNYEYNIITPDHLEFKAVGFNGCPDAVADESDDKKYLTVNIKETPAFFKSAITATNANRVSFIYKLYKNNLRSKTEELLNYSAEAKAKYKSVMTATDDEKKIIKNFIKKNKLFTKKSGLDLILEIEKYMKKEFKRSYFSGNDLEIALKNKRGSSNVIAKIYAAFFTHFDIKYELCFMTSRFYVPFDQTYENLTYIGEMLFYFPVHEGFIMPNNVNKPMNLFNPSFRERNAVFFTEFGVNDFKAAKAYIDSIPGLPANKNFVTQNVDINLEDTKNAIIKIEEKIGGYNAISYHDFLKDIDYEGREDLFTGLCKYRLDDAVFIEGDLDSIKLDKSVLENPVGVRYSFSSKSVVAENGNKIALNVGSFINDSKKIQEKPKNIGNPDVDYGHVKLKTISIGIPAGYKVSNLNNLNLNKTFTADGLKNAMIFEMSAKLLGNRLELTIKESFFKANFNKKEIDNFLEVYNAAYLLKDLQVIFEKQ